NSGLDRRAGEKRRSAKADRGCESTFTKTMAPNAALLLGVRLEQRLNALALRGDQAFRVFFEQVPLPTKVVTGLGELLDVTVERAVLALHRRPGISGLRLLPLALGEWNERSDHADQLVLP